ncbi:MAG TPA: ABC transporter permease [Polyangiaceae bacterium]|nr:ABC transporter permease [Polyangiaceae bacterium]
MSTADPPAPPTHGTPGDAPLPDALAVAPAKRSLLAPLKRTWRRWIRGFAIGFGVVHAVLAWLALRLPAPHGTSFKLKHEAIRYGAAATAVLFTIFALVALMPWFFDRLEGRTFRTFVAVRHVRASKSGFLTVISVLSILGVAVSSCALCGVTSVMGGFGADLKRKILGNNAHITIDTSAIGGFTDWEDALNRVRLVPGITAATPVVRGEGMASSATTTAGVLVRGIDPGSIGNVIELVNNIEVGKFDYLEHPDKLTRLSPDEVIGLGSGGEPYLKGPDLTFGGADVDPSVKDSLRGPPVYPGLAVGREFAKTLHAYVGDEITLVSPLGDLGPMGILPRSRKFRIAAIFYSGMYEYDAAHAYMTIESAQSLFSLGESISAIEVKVPEAERASEVRGSVEEALQRSDLRVRDWRELNKNLFSALKLEKIATFIILSIAILVASFCIICTLLLMVTEKGKEIAILKAVGATDTAILQVFMLEGVVIGAIGTILGVMTGLAFCLSLSIYGVRLDPEVYYIDRLPVAVNASDYLAVAVAAMLICTISTIYPARAASQLKPVDGLRYE